MPPKAKKGVGATLVLVDIGAGMSKKLENDEKTNFEAAREAADWIFSRKIFAQAPERMGIVAYGSRITENSLNFEGVQVFNEILTTASFDHLRFINKEIEQNSEDTGNVFYGLTVAADVLIKFAEENSEIDEKTIVLLTNGLNENISKENLDLLSEKLQEFSIDLMIIGISDTDTYPSAALKDLAESLDGTVYTFENMLPALQNFVPKTSETRNNNKLWEIAPGIRLPVAFSTKSAKTTSSGLKFSLADDFGSKVVRVNQLVIENEEGETQTFAHVPKNISTTATNAIFSTESDRNEVTLKMMAPDQIPAKGGEFEEKDEEERSSSNLMELEKEKQCVGFYFGKSLIFFDENDFKENFNNHNFNEGEKGGCLKLIQFTKRCNIQPSYLIGDKSYTVLPQIAKKVTNQQLNLTKCTISLIEAMLEMDVVAICRYAFSVSSNLQLFSLIAHRDEESGSPFLRAIRLPFADDMKSLKMPKIDENDEETKPSLAQLNAIDDLIDLLQFDEQTTQNFTQGGIVDPQLQMQCFFLKSKVLNTEDDVLQHLENAKRVLETNLEPFKAKIEENGDFYDRLAREFNLERIEKQKRQRVEMERLDMRGIIEEWQMKKEDSPESKKRKEHMSRKDELEEEFHDDSRKAAAESCENSLKTIKNMCMFPENASRKQFFDVLLDELQAIRELCVFYGKDQAEIFNDSMTKLKNFEEFKPFAEFLGDNRALLPIVRREVSDIEMEDEEALEFWEI